MYKNSNFLKDKHLNNYKEEEKLSLPFIRFLNPSLILGKIRWFITGPLKTSSQWIDPKV